MRNTDDGISNEGADQDRFGHGVGARLVGGHKGIERLVCLAVGGEEAGVEDEEAGGLAHAGVMG